MTAQGFAAPSPDAPTRGKPRILIIKPSSLGDVVHGLPVLAALRAAHPRAHVAWLVGKAFAPLLENHPLLDEIVIFDRKRLGRLWILPGAMADLLRLVSRLRRARFDIVVDLQGLVRSAFFAWACGAPQRIGFTAARELAWLFYTRRVACPAEIEHAVERNLHLARALGWPAVSPRFPLAITEAERRAAQRSLADAGVGAPYVAVLPGARWPSKRWPPRRFAELMDRIQSSGGPTCVLLGAPDERPLVAEIVAACRTPPANLVGRTTLRELAAVLEGAQRVISQDSGPMHLAAALGRPLVALFGPTNPRRTGPYSASAQTVTHAVPCAPCYRRRCPLRHHDCLEKLAVQQVIDAMDGPGAGATMTGMGAAGFEPA
ncbi:MAG TPA: lipopolysaccharide heptosyltransferase I [Phycisphaerae bacterium]|nr:lipopolysaccharide heptosyltransferase I [Phycisphaerae bacterium]